MGTDERKGRAVSHRGPHPVRRRKDRVVIGIVLSLALLLFNVGLSFIFTSRLANRMEAVKGREVELFDAAWQVRYLDEVLTHSASEYVLSGGDTKWRTRYDQYVVELDRVLADLRQRGDRKIVGKLDEVNAANNALVALETRVFQEADNRDFAAATRLLSGPYVEQKAMYRKGLDAFFAAQRQRFDGIVQKAKDGVRLLRILTVVSSAVLFGALLVLGQVHRRQADLIDRRDREQADEFAKQSFEQRLARTLEMAQTEDQTLESVSNVFDAELTTGVA